MLEKWTKTVEIRKIGAIFPEKRVLLARNRSQNSFPDVLKYFNVVFSEK